MSDSTENYQFNFLDGYFYVAITELMTTATVTEKAIDAVKELVEIQIENEINNSNIPESNKQEIIAAAKKRLKATMDGVKLRLKQSGRLL